MPYQFLVLTLFVLNLLSVEGLGLSMHKFIPGNYITEFRMDNTTRFGQSTVMLT